MPNLCKHGVDKWAACEVCHNDLMQAQDKPGVTELAELYSGNYGMNETRAQEILGDDIKLNGRIYKSDEGEVEFNMDDKYIYLDGRFTPEYLKALIWWMENKASE